MKTLRNFHFIYFSLFFFIFFSSLLAQSDFCGTSDELTSYASDLNFIGGYLKPQRTDLSNGSPAPPDAKFNIILVFIRFKYDNVDAPDWPVGYPPTYMDSLLSPTKNVSGNYWERYSSINAHLSDYYQEISRGTMHVTGITRYIEMDHDNSYYKPAPLGIGYTAMLNEIYGKLKADNTIHWPDFDHWGQGASDGNFEYSSNGDGHIDMMGLIFRNDPAQVMELPGNAGYVPLYGPNEYLIDPGNSKYIGNSRNFEGSGFVADGNQGVINKWRAIGICIHEMGHYFFANNHSTCGIMTSRGGMSLSDYFYSGFQRYKLGYINATTVNFSNNSYILDDVSAGEQIIIWF